MSRVQRAVAGLSFVAALASCTAASPEGTSAPTADSAHPATDAPAPAPPAPPASTAASVGTYTVGDSQVTLTDALVIPGEANELRILYTPTPLSGEERRAILANPEWPGSVLLQKTGGGYPDRYPYVVATFRYEGTPTFEHMRTFHLLAYGIHEVNYTDNVNGPVNDLGYTLERLEVQGDRVALAFSGSTSFGDIPRSWSIRTPY